VADTSSLQEHTEVSSKAHLVCGQSLVHVGARSTAAHGDRQAVSGRYRRRVFCAGGPLWWWDATFGWGQSGRRAGGGLGGPVQPEKAQERAVWSHFWPAVRGKRCALLVLEGRLSTGLPLPALRAPTCATAARWHHSTPTEPRHCVTLRLCVSRGPHRPSVAPFVERGSPVGRHSRSPRLLLYVCSTQVS